MTRAWVVDLLSALAMMAITIALVTFLDGPRWAAAGFGLIVYLVAPRNAQFKEKAKADGHWGVEATK